MSQNNDSLEDGEIEDDIPQDNQKINSSQNQHLCTVCQSKSAKYKCPACNNKTCSLTCVKNHKQVYSCSGKKDPTGMIKMSQYTEKEAKKDYKFLSDIILATEVIEKRLVGTTALPDALRYKLLKQQAKKMNIDVRLAPKLLQRHRDNISFYSCADKQIYWCVDIKAFLPTLDGNQFIIKQLDPVQMNSTIKEILLQGDLFSSEALQQHEINLNGENLIYLIEKGHVSIYYPFEKLTSFTEQEEYKFKNQKKSKLNRKILNLDEDQQEKAKIEYNLIDLNSRLYENIKGSTIYEYPVLVLVPKKYENIYLNPNTKKLKL